MNIVYKSYLIVLGITVGMILSLGALGAPVVFHSNELTGIDALTHYKMGLIMSEMFVRGNYILGFATLFIAMFEWRSFWYERDKVNTLVSFVILSVSSLFLFYYTPAIVKMQNIGAEATATDAFNGMHIGSEIAYKVLLVSITVLLYRRIGMKPDWIK